VVKVNAPELLRGQFDKRSWRGETIAFSGITDCYQPLEAAYRLTRRCLEVCLEYRNPVGVITKGAVVRRDVDVLADLSRRARAHVTLSIPFADDETGRKIEPYASPISKRFETLRILSEAGISTGIAIAPVIPGLNDSKIPELLARAKDAGAQSAFMVLLRLPREVRPVFDVRLDQVLPERAAKIRSQIKQMRGGKMNEAMFHARMHGVGPRWDVIQALFDGHARRLGLIDDHDDDGGTGGETEIEEPTTFRRPSAQRDLFEDL